MAPPVEIPEHHPHSDYGEDDGDEVETDGRVVAFAIKPFSQTSGGISTTGESDDLRDYTNADENEVE